MNLGSRLCPQTLSGYSYQSYSIINFLFFISDAEKFDFYGEFSSVLMDFAFGFCEMKIFELILAKHLSLLPLLRSWKIHEKTP